MNRISRLAWCFLALCSVIITSCKTEIEDEPQLCDYSLDIAYKWYNTHTTIDTYADATHTKKISSSTVSTVGFLKVDPNGTYEVVNNDVAQLGNWRIDAATCKLILDDKAVTTDYQYDILSLTANSLAIKKVQGEKVYTQFYKTASCPTINQLAKQWDNRHTFYFNYHVSANLINNPELIYPVGYFKLNTDYSYNVVSNGVPLDGSWKLGQPYCMLDLDANRPNARSFEVVKLTPDSLVIWRKDATASKAYLQYYLKH